jgi:hypothetical protein
VRRHNRALIAAIPLLPRQARRLPGTVQSLVQRSQPGLQRDYLDTAAALERYTPEQLISFAARLDPGLEGEDFADAARRLDQLPGEAFVRLGVREADVTALRERFAAWPRQAKPAGNGSPNPKPGSRSPPVTRQGMRRIWRSGTKPNPKRRSDLAAHPRRGRGRRDRVTELAKPIGRLAGTCQPAPVPARGEVIRRVTSSPGWSASSVFWALVTKM